MANPKTFQTKIIKPSGQRLQGLQKITKQILQPFISITQEGIKLKHSSCALVPQKQRTCPDHFGKHLLLPALFFGDFILSLSKDFPSREKVKEVQPIHGPAQKKVSITKIDLSRRGHAQLRTRNYAQRGVTST